MQITLNITEDSKVELVKDNCELVQGECCFTDFVFNFPDTIKGYSTSEYVKTIEFGECKEIGECVKFVDEINGDRYELNEMCTAFKKIMVQIVLERGADGHKITWKTIPFTLEFVESVNANGNVVIQTQLLCLSDIQNRWETFVKANCLRMVYSFANVPTASAENDGDTIFYLGDNTDDGAFVYGYYYRCTADEDGVYAWECLTKDASLVDVANGIREINKNKTMQMWIGTAEEYKNVIPQNDVVYILADTSQKELFHEILTEMAADETYKLAYPLTFENGVLKFAGKAIPQREKVNFAYWTGEIEGVTKEWFALTNATGGDVLEICYSLDADGNDIRYVKGQKEFILSGTSSSGEKLEAILSLDDDYHLEILNTTGETIDLNIISITKIIE